MVPQYSMTQSLYNDGLMSRNQLLERHAEKFWASEFSICQVNQYSRLVCEGDLLMELSVTELIKDNLSNVLQAGIGYALETGITIGSFGVGAPAGVAAEMINDMVFFGYSAGDAVASIKGFFSDLAEMKEVVKEMMSSTVADTPQKIYDRVKSVINKLGSFFDKIGVPVEKGIEKLKELYRKLMSKMAKVAGDTLALISPIPGTDAIVQNAITQFADDAYKTIVGVFDKLPEFITKYVNDPKLMAEDAGKVIDSCLEFLRKIYGKESKDKSFLAKVTGFAKDAAVLGPVGLILKTSGAYDKLFNWLEGKAKPLIKTATDAYAKIYPIMLSVASALTIVVNNDHDIFKSKEDGSKTKKQQESRSLTLTTALNEIGRNYQTLSNDPYSWKDNTALDVQVYANTDGSWSAKIEDRKKPKRSTALRKFSDEYSAKSWVEKTVDVMTRRHLSEI